MSTRVYLTALVDDEGLVETGVVIESERPDRFMGSVVTPKATATLAGLLPKFTEFAQSITTKEIPSP